MPRQVFAQTGGAKTKSPGEGRATLRHGFGLDGDTWNYEVHVSFNDRAVWNFNPQRRPEPRSIIRIHFRNDE